MIDTSFGNQLLGKKFDKSSTSLKKKNPKLTIIF
jgi:hypothetical protein